MSKYIRQVVPLFFFLILIGALGLVTKDKCDAIREECADPGARSGDCAGDRAYLDTGEKMLCYHEAAISQAIACGRNSQCPRAESICEEMILIAGLNKRNIAETQRNYCLQDVARYTRNEQTCNKILQESSALDFLRGADATRETCITAVRRSRAADPEGYLRGGENLCALAYILPLALFVAFLAKERD